MNILITGATGFIGRHLVRRLQQDHHTIRVLSRDGMRAGEMLEVPAFEWDYATQDVPAAALHDCQIIINLMGENLGDGRWTKVRKHEIYASRILSTRKLVAAAPDSLQALICGSAIGIYPGQGNDLYDESYAVPEQLSFMQTICHDWEMEAARIESKGVRRVSIRTGVVLGHGGILQKLLPGFSILDWAAPSVMAASGCHGYILTTLFRFTSKPLLIRVIMARSMPYPPTRCATGNLQPR